MKYIGNFKKFIILFIYIAFIFSNSLTPAVQSSKNSDFFAFAANNFLSFFDVSLAYSTLTFIIRKSAHFIEYTLLGLLLQNTFSPYTKKIRLLLLSFFTLFIPVIDELFQKITPGRSCEIRDMLIDATGILCGILIYFLIVKLYKKHTNPQYKSK